MTMMLLKYDFTTNFANSQSESRWMRQLVSDWLLAGFVEGKIFNEFYFILGWTIFRQLSGQRSSKESAEFRQLYRRGELPHLQL